MHRYLYKTIMEEICFACFRLSADTVLLIWVLSCNASFRCHSSNITGSLAGLCVLLRGKETAGFLLNTGCDCPESATKASFSNTVKGRLSWPGFVVTNIGWQLRGAEGRDNGKLEAWSNMGEQYWWVELEGCLSKCIHFHILLCFIYFVCPRLTGQLIRTKVQLNKKPGSTRK